MVFLPGQACPTWKTTHYDQSRDFLSSSFLKELVCVSFLHFHTPSLVSFAEFCFLIISRLQIQQFNNQNAVKRDTNAVDISLTQQMGTKNIHKSLPLPEASFRQLLVIYHE